MEWSWIIFFAIAALAWWQRPDIRREMYWAAALAFPIVFLLVQNGVPQTFQQVLLTINRLLTGVMLATFASIVYELVFRRYLSPSMRSDRWIIKWVMAGPVVFLILALGFNWNWPGALSVAVVIDLGIILLLRRELIWDAIVSAAAVGGLYILVALILTALPGGFLERIFPSPSWPVSLYGVAIDELILVMLFGALWGPLYAAVKHYREPAPDRNAKFMRPKVLTASIMLILVLGGLAWGANATMAAPGIQNVSPEPQTDKVSLAGPIQITFTRPVSRDDLELHVTPEVDGAWTFADSLLSSHAYRTAIFKPETGFAPDTKYTLDIKEATSLLGMGNGKWQFTFTTRSLPSVQSVSPDFSTSISGCDAFTVKLTDTHTHVADFSFALEPHVDLAVKPNARLDTYELTPARCLDQGAVYTLHIKRQLTVFSPELNRVISRGSDEEVFNKQFQVTPPPEIASISPNGNTVSRKTKMMQVTFTHDMLPETSNSFVLEPKLEGSWKWTSPTQAEYTFSQDLPPQTVVVFRIPTGTKDGADGFFPAEATHAFVTLGPVAVANISPSSEASGISTKSAIRVTFNQGVDGTSAAEHFSIDPNIGGTTSMDGTALMFQPNSELQKDTKYTVRISAGVSGTEGEILASAFQSSFTTEVSRKILSIGLDYQDKALSCEAAALKMALAGKGVRVSEDDIMQIVGYDPTSHRSDVWGDPDKAFVGSITGRQNSSGYGVHWDPIARAAQKWRKADAFQGWTVQQLAQALADGNPVVIWGTLGPAYHDPWKTPSGRTINAWKGEHARTAIGFVGSVADPQQFIINDPINGRITWSTAALKANWGRFNNSGVVVY